MADVPQPPPLKPTVTLYAALCETVTVGVSTNGEDEDVVVLMPGPLHVYTGVPEPPVSVAVSVKVPPEHKAVEEGVNDVTEPGAVIFTLAVVAAAVTHPVLTE